MFCLYWLVPVSFVLVSKFWGFIKNRYAEQLLDLYGATIEYYQNIIKYVDLGITLLNLLDRSRSPISSGSLSFIVDEAPSFREHQFVAWFYRNHQIPDENDWIFALRLFKMDKIPEHALLRLIQEIPLHYGGNVSTNVFTNVFTNLPHRIMVMIDHLSHQRGITSEKGKCIVGEIVAGCLAPRQLFRDVR